MIDDQPNQCVFNSLSDERCALLMSNSQFSSFFSLGKLAHQPHLCMLIIENYQIRFGRLICTMEKL